MGGVVPKGKNNDELVDNLIEAKYLSDPRICRIFRQVDRGDFYPGEFYEDAYRDQAMKSGNLHLSAPCIYCSVMENMDLHPGNVVFIIIVMIFNLFEWPSLVIVKKENMIVKVACCLIKNFMKQHATLPNIKFT